MKIFDVFVLPSRAEGLPLSILEASLMGISIIATDVGSVRDTVLDGETGFVAKSGDLAGLTAALKHLVDESQLPRRFGKRDRTEALERFNLWRMIKGYESLYDEMLGRS